MSLLPHRATGVARSVYLCPSSAEKVEGTFTLPAPAPTCWETPSGSPTLTTTLPISAIGLRSHWYPAVFALGRVILRLKE